MRDLHHEVGHTEQVASGRTPALLMMQLHPVVDAGERCIGDHRLLLARLGGHVLTHVARNADGGTRMLTWARTGVETREYASLRARAEEIEAGSGRAASSLLADVRDSASRFTDAYLAMPHTEVLVHHVDLRPGHWPADFVEALLADVVAAFAGRPEVPSLHLTAVDTAAEYRLGVPVAARAVRAEQAHLLAWLLGRSDGVDSQNDRPALPFLY